MNESSGVPTGAGGGNGAADLDVGGLVSQAWEKFVANVVPFVIMGLLVQVITGITFGIAGGYMAGGMFLVWIALLRDGKVPEIGDIFGPGRMFLPLLLFMFLFVLISVITLGIGAFIFGTLWMYTVALIAEKNMGLTDAWNASKEKVKEVGFGTHFIILVVLIVIQFAASIGAGLVGKILGPAAPLVNIAIGCAIVPIITGVIAGAYVQLFGAGEVAGSAGQLPTSTPEPASGGQPPVAT